ncbi:MAG: hypothetical protein NZZ41_02225 [Candidatus Dojkabacteria bacterium]|nr:hypothetical protein [Candidatus Dojkabacteria bacterium]
MEEQVKKQEATSRPINFNSLGIFFYAPREFEPIPLFGKTPEQQLLTILKLFQQGILVEGFYRTIVANNE